MHIRLFETLVSESEPVHLEGYVITKCFVIFVSVVVLSDNMLLGACAWPMYNTNK